jgi:hypothetical protein
MRNYVTALRSDGCMGNAVPEDNTAYICMAKDGGRGFIPNVGVHVPN